MSGPLPALPSAGDPPAAGLLGTRRPRAFVVMPYGRKPAGAPGQPQQVVDFDAVYAQLLAPALSAAGWEPFRADQEPGAGDVRTDLYFELVTAELVVVDVSAPSPNVFYELGVRHGVAARGVLTVHGGFGERPFDVAPDRTIPYDGRLFRDATSPPDALGQEVRRLADRVRQALAVDGERTASPLYKELTGLVPPESHRITGGRGRYRDVELLEWRGRLRAAEVADLPGDVLTLAQDAPDRRRARELALAAARALEDLGRFGTAREVLEDLAGSAPDDAAVLLELGQVLGRLGLAAQAERRLVQAAAVSSGEPASHALRGRLAKDRWRLAWRAVPEPAERRALAARRCALAEEALLAYGDALRCDLASHYSAVNVLGLAALLAHLGADVPPLPLGTWDEVAVLAALSARAALPEPRAGAPDEGGAGGPDRAWPYASLGEVALLRGDDREAVRCYRRAVAAARGSRFHLESMAGQLRTYADLGLRQDLAQAVVEELEQELPPTVPAYRRVVVGAGHMLDAPDRPHPRFPREREPAVAREVLAVLVEEGVGPGDLVLTSGACGADMLIAEAGLGLGAHVRLLLPLPAEQVAQRSLAGWRGELEPRLWALLERCEVREQSRELGRPPAGTDAYERANVWCLSTARVEAGDTRPLALVVWDGSDAADGRGGTAHFVHQARRLGARVRTVDPLPP